MSILSQDELKQIDTVLIEWTKILKCGVCNSLLTNAVSLESCHCVFCEPCLSEHMAVNHRSNTCPRCTIPFRIKEIVENHVYRNLTAVFRPLLDKIGPTQQVCETIVKKRKDPTLLPISPNKPTKHIRFDIPGSPSNSSSDCSQKRLQRRNKSPQSISNITSDSDVEAVSAVTSPVSTNSPYYKPVTSTNDISSVLTSPIDRNHLTISSTTSSISTSSSSEDDDSERQTEWLSKRPTEDPNEKMTSHVSSNVSCSIVTDIVNAPSTRSECLPQNQPQEILEAVDSVSSLKTFERSCSFVIAYSQLDEAKLVLVKFALTITI